MRGGGGGGVSLLDINNPSSPLQSLFSSFLPNRAPPAGAMVVDDSPKVKVQVSIEALCIDSKHFILNDLIPTYHLLGSNIIDLELLPFGNAKITPTTPNNNKQQQSIKCQHGKAECDANSYEQCLIATYPNPPDYLPAIECLFQTLPMGYSDNTFNTNMFQDCSVGLDFTKIRSCHEDEGEAWKLQLDNYERTPVDHTHVPWVTVNGEYLDEEKEKLDVGICSAFVKGGGKSQVCDAILAENIDIE